METTPEHERDLDRLALVRDTLSVVRDAVNKHDAQRMNSDLLQGTRDWHAGCCDAYSLVQKWLESDLA